MEPKRHEEEKVNSRRDVDEFVDETLMEVKQEGDRIRRMKKIDQRRHLQNVGVATVEAYDKWFLTQNVHGWATKQENPSLAVADAIDSLLGSELLENEAASDEQLDEARKGKVNVPYAVSLLEVLKTEGQRLAAKESNEVDQEILMDMLQRAHRRIEKVMEWENRSVVQERWGRSA